MPPANIILKTRAPPAAHPPIEAPITTDALQTADTDALLAEGRRVRARAPREAMALATRAYGLAVAAGDRRGEARALAFQARCHLDLGDIAACFEAGRAAVRLAEAIDDPATQARALTAMAAAHHAVGDFAEALYLYDQAVPLEEAIGEPVALLATLGDAAGAEVALGNHDAALALVARIRAVREREGITPPAASLNNEANIRFLKSTQVRDLPPEVVDAELARALTLATAAIERAVAEGRVTVEATALLTAADIHSARGAHREALALIERAEAAALRCESRYLTVYARASRGEALMRLTEHEAARQVLEAALPEAEGSLLARDQVARLCRLLSDLHATRGDTAKSLAYLQRVADLETLNRENAAIRRQRALAARRDAAAAEKQREKSQQRIVALEQELAHASRLTVMGEMVAGIAHELNQPLSAAINLCYAAMNGIGRGDTDPAVYADYVARAEKAIVRASEVLERFRRFAANKPMALTATDLAAAVADSIEILRGDDRLRGVAVTVTGEAPAVIADRVLLIQVLVNLVRNAVEAMEGSARRSLTFALAEEAGTARLTLTDSGPGFPPAQLAAEFQPFHSTKRDGLGLGLSLCHRIVESFGGRMAIGNAAGGGAEVRVTLPVAGDA